MRWSDVTPEDLYRVSEMGERRLTAAEWQAYVGQPVTAEERQGIEGLLDWFARRYPTPQERLRYARGAYRRWRAK